MHSQSLARVLWPQLLLLLLALLFCMLHATTARAEGLAAGPVRVGKLSLDQARIVGRARLETIRGVKYAGAWQRTSGYPMGDIPLDRGACTDLVVRSYRAAGIDLQQLVHEDMLAAGQAYGVERPDPTIDHRRVTTLFVYFQRNAERRSTDPHDVASFAPGDVVFFGPTASNRATRPHVAIVSDRIGPRGLPLLLEHGGGKPVESDSLDRQPIVGHFHPKLGASPASDNGRSER